MNLLKGSCACGDIEYEIQGEPEFSFHCQCRQCQRITGSGHASQLMVKVDNTTISGKLTFYTQLADGENTKSSGFCATCGSPILTKVREYPDMLYFHAASLNDPSQFHPQKILYDSSKQPWDYTDPKLSEE